MGARRTVCDDEVNIAKMIDFCDDALTNLSYFDREEDPRYTLWLALTSLANKLPTALAIARDSSLKSLINVMLGNTTSCDDDLIKAGIVEVVYKLERDNIPPVIEGKVEEVLEKVKQRLVPQYRLKDEVKSYLRGLLDSPKKIKVSELAKENVLEMLLKSEVCELYIVPRGYPVDKTLWFRGLLPQSDDLERVGHGISGILQTWDKLSEPAKSYLKPHVETLRKVYQSLNSLKEPPREVTTCTHSNAITIDTRYNMRGDVVAVLKYCPDCGRRWRETT